MGIARSADPAVIRPSVTSTAVHYAALDLMRAAAAGMVFLFHAGIPGAPFELANGLRVFFVLSGFVIYLPFARARGRGERIALVPYLVRRALRIYPAYLVAAFGITALSGGPFVLDPWTLLTIGWWPVIVMWTLAVEIQFYALVPILDWMIGRIGRRERDRSIAVIAGLAVASLAYVAVVVTVGTAGGGTMSHIEYANGLGYLWAFAGGMIVAELAARGQLRLAGLRTPVAIGAGIGLIVIGSVLQLALLDIVTVAGATLLLAGLVGVRLGRRATAAAGAAAAVSYSFYLWHSWVVDRLDAPAPVSLIVSLAIATTVYLLLERPILAIGAGALRRRDSGIALPSARVVLDPPVA